MLVLCLGNDLRSDDGVGWQIADTLLREPPEGATILKSALSGLHLLDELCGYSTVLVVDAIRTGNHVPGTVLSFPLQEIRAPAGPFPHTMGVPSILQRASEMGLEVPRRVHVVAVEVEDLVTLKEGLSGPVQSCISEAARAVRDAIIHLEKSDRQEAEVP